jgi:DNA sulfur modification protein DndD
MRFLTLIVENVGVYAGPHRFDLAPDHAQHTPDLTLIIGHNGAGKSTLFQAIALALHGRLALGDRISSTQYKEHLFGLLHRAKPGSMPRQAPKAGVHLVFEYVRSGQPLTVSVVRDWQLALGEVNEQLTVTSNGQPLDVPAEDYQTWLNDLVPPGLLPICLFDAERLDALASPNRHDAMLAEMLRRLLGLDLVRRLQLDLDHYVHASGLERKVEQLRAEALQAQSELDEVRANHVDLLHRRQELADELAGLETALADQERRLAAEGGAYAARRPELLRQQQHIQAEIDELSEQMRELAADLLPFALAPRLCRRLSRQLTAETEVLRNEAVEELWEERIVQVVAALQAQNFWEGLSIHHRQRESIARRTEELLKSRRSDSPSVPLVHRLTKTDQERLQHWIEEALDATPAQVQSLGTRLRTLQVEQRKVETEIQRAPDEATLAPLHAEVMRLESAAAALRRQINELDDQLALTRYKPEDLERRLKQIDEQLSAASKAEHQIRLANNARVALRAYQDALTRQRSAALERTLLQSFNALCRKEHLLSQVEINPDNNRINLYGENGNLLKLGDFSAGERQLYGLALLQALREVSGRDLPLVIDTPLARLDGAHRRRFVDDYLPNVASQVVLLTTDAEIDAEVDAAINTQVARRYTLRFDQEGGTQCALR